jgi:hypothetical protein
LLDLHLNEMLFSREIGRLRSLSTPAEIRWVLQVIAFTMQSSKTQRVTIDEESIMNAVRAPASLSDAPPPFWVGDLDRLATRTGILSVLPGSDGSHAYAFTHTAFREYLAASYLVDNPTSYAADAPRWEQDLDFVVSTLAAHLHDASWAAVLAAVVQLGLQRHGESYVHRLHDSAAKRDPDLAAAIAKELRLRAT